MGQWVLCTKKIKLRDFFFSCIFYSAVIQGLLFSNIDLDSQKTDCIGEKNAVNKSSEGFFQSVKTHENLLEPHQL